MKLTLLCVGKLSSPWLRDGAEDYQARIRRYLPLNVVELKEEKGGKKGDPRQVRDGEGERLLQRLGSDVPLLVLDENGKGCSSEELAQLLENRMLNGTQELAFVIGGAYGLSDAVKKRGKLLSLSRMTLTHQMARLLLCEQIYRGLTIIRNEPYHNR
ncbi:MAG: 50S rRNA methyltransferase [Desulfuromonas sp.]|nr:MAG: 50S rRNA methyltransferase [Desulfuromonas sp.]